MNTAALDYSASGSSAAAAGAALELRLARFRQAACGNGLDVRVHLAPARDSASALPAQPSKKSDAFVRSVVLASSLAAAGILGVGVYGLSASHSPVVQTADGISHAEDSAPEVFGGEVASTPVGATGAKASGTKGTLAKGSNPEGSAQFKEIKDLKDPRAIAAQLKYVNVTYAGVELKTLDAGSRILLAKAAASKAGLSDVGLSWQDLYGVIHAETSWIARGGMGRNGVASHGLAQFEPGTAKEMSLKNPNDPVEAVFASAALIKRAALWTHERITPLKLGADRSKEVLLEGVSVYYNLGWKRRHAWKPAVDAHAQKLPTPTVAHIQNVENGAIIAKEIEKELAKSGLVLAVDKQNPMALAQPLPAGAKTSLDGSDRTLKVIEAEVLREQRLRASMKAQLALRSAKSMAAPKTAARKPGHVVAHK